MASEHVVDQDLLSLVGLSNVDVVHVVSSEMVVQRGHRLLDFEREGLATEFFFQKKKENQSFSQHRFPIVCLRGVG